jgi:hypothetical protein
MKKPAHTTTSSVPLTWDAIRELVGERKVSRRDNYPPPPQAFTVREFAEGMGLTYDRAGKQLLNAWSRKTLAREWLGKAGYIYFPAQV